MRLVALALFGALSVLAVGCATEDTSGTKTKRPSIGVHEDSGDDDSDSTTAPAGTTGESGIAKPVTPADGPVPADNPGAATTTKPVIQAQPIACNTDEDSVTQSYRVALQRDPDPGGLQNWVGAIQNGDTRLGVLNKILTSQEFVSVHANLTDDEFLSYLYHSFFNRDPDPGGRQGWLNALAGGQSRSSVAQAFANSEEFKSPSSNRATACYF